MDGPGSGEGAEVPGAVLTHASGHEDLGEVILPGDLDVRVAFVILEPNVVVGPVTLDQVHLQDQRLQLRSGDDEVDAGHMRHHVMGL